MNGNIIQVKYDNLDQVAAQFGQQAESTTELDTRVRQGLQALEQGGWVGRGASAFFVEMNNELLPAMQRLSHVLGEARSVTLEVKEIIMAAEQEAAALFGKGTAAGGMPGGSGPGGLGGIVAAPAGGEGSNNGHTSPWETADRIFNVVESAFGKKFLEGPTSRWVEGMAAGMKNGSFKDWLGKSAGIAGHIPGWGIGTAFSFLGSEPSGRGWVHDLTKAGITTAIGLTPWVRGPMLVNDVIQLGGQAAGALGYKGVQEAVEKVDLHKPIDWIVEQQMERIEDGGVVGVLKRLNPVTAPIMGINDAVQIVGGKLLGIHGIEKLDLEHLL